MKFGQFSLNQAGFAAMDGPGNHNFEFNEGVSIVVACETQNEIGHYWNKLSAGGGKMQCGWLKDGFGVCWQIVPTILESLMNNRDKAEKVTAAFMKIKKFEIEKLMRAID